jgi:hypothetical protein
MIVHHIDKTIKTLRTSKNTVNQTFKAVVQGRLFAVTMIMMLKFTGFTHSHSG